MIYAVIMAAMLQPERVAPAQLVTGLQGLWQPGTLLFLQGVWLVIFLYTGRSTVTGATLSFHVHHERI
jgi:hypothetical protein